MNQRYGARAHRKVDVDVFRTIYHVVTSINQPNSWPWAVLAAVTIAEISAFYVSILLHRKKALAESSFATQLSVGWLQHCIAPGINSRNIVARHVDGDTRTIRAIFRARIVCTVTELRQMDTTAATIFFTILTIKNIYRSDNLYIIYNKNWR